MKKKVSGFIVLTGLTLLMACGDVSENSKEVNGKIESAETKASGEEQEETKATQIDQNENSSENQNNGGNENFHEAEGKWIYLVELWNDPEYNTNLEYTIPEYTYEERYVRIYEEDGISKIDYINNYEEGIMEVYGRKLNEEDPDGFRNFMIRESEYCTVTYDVNLEDSETLVVRLRYLYTESDSSEYLYYYKREGCDLEAELDEYRYRETVTVSNVKELYNAIGSHKKILLKTGVYNFSELTEADKQNPYVNSSTEYFTYPLDWSSMAQAWCNDVEYMILEGEEGAEVEICTEDGFMAPFVFSNCRHITLRNLTVGHLVEPGYCAGAVIELEYTSYMNIENCRLYGSGTYGIDADSSYDIYVKDSDIYECTYGLVYFDGVDGAVFENCTLRDSEAYQMFLFINCAWSISFQNCKISGNDSGTNNYPLIDAENAWGSICFESCEITDNTYSTLYSGDVSFTNCTIQ